jgi:hypothetical protein
LGWPAATASHISPVFLFIASAFLKINVIFSKRGKTNDNRELSSEKIVVSLFKNWTCAPLLGRTEELRNTKHKMAYLLVFNRVYRPEIQSVKLVFSTPLVNCCPSTFSLTRENERGWIKDGEIGEIECKLVICQTSSCMVEL